MPPPEPVAGPAGRDGAAPPSDQHTSAIEIEGSAADRQCTYDEARSLTARIKIAVEELWGLIVQAYRRGAWLALGYSTWQNYCAEEFGTDRIKIPTSERPAVVSLMSDAGMSLREISAATGLSKTTVARSTSVPDGTDDDHEPLARRLLRNATPADIEMISNDPRVQVETSRQRNRYRPIKDPAPAEKPATSLAEGIEHLLLANLVHQWLEKIVDHARRGMFDKLDAEIKSEARDNLAKWRQMIDFTDAIIAGQSVSDQALSQWLNEDER